MAEEHSSNNEDNNERNSYVEDELTPIDATELLGLKSKPGESLSEAETESPFEETVEEGTASPEVDEEPPPEEVAQIGEHMVERLLTEESFVQESSIEETESVPEQVSETLESVEDEEHEEEIVEEPQVPDEFVGEFKEFENLISEYMPNVSDLYVGDVIEVSVVDVKSNYVLVDVGDKAEGVVDIEEFFTKSGNINIAVGDVIPILILGRDNESDQILVSHTKARQQLALDKVRRAHRNQTPIKGVVSGIASGGLIIDLGLPCFMPASQIDLRRVNDLSSMLEKELEALVIGLNEKQNRIILSRRRLLELDLEEKRQKILNSLEVEESIVGKIKSVLDFGAFVDLGGIDAFVPREEVSYEKGAHPAQYLREGKDAKFKVISVDIESGRIALSRKQLKPDPWVTLPVKHPKDSLVKGKVTNITRFGAFVKIEEGLTGLLHISDLTWEMGRKNVEEFVKEGDHVKAVVLNYDLEEQRLALGLKQITPDPWAEIDTKYSVGTKVKGVVISILRFGIFIKLDEEFEGFIHLDELTWKKNLGHPAEIVKTGEEVEALVKEVDTDARRIVLSMKQLSKSPFQLFIQDHQINSIVKGKVVRLESFGAFVRLAPHIDGLLHVSQIDEKRVENPNETLKVGQEIECKIIRIDVATQRISLSRKAYLKEREKREVSAYIGQKISGGQNVGELLQKLDIALGSNSKKE